MTSELDLVDERIKRLEKFVLGQAVSQHGDKLIDTILGVSEKLANVVSRNERVSSALKRADEIKKYADPLYAEFDGFISDDVKLQLLHSKENEIKEALIHLKDLMALKCFIDSQAIKDVSLLEDRINKISLYQETQGRKVSSLCNDTYAVLNTYSKFVNDVSQKLAVVEKSISMVEVYPSKQ